MREGKEIKRCDTLCFSPCFVAPESRSVGVVARSKFTSRNVNKKTQVRNTFDIDLFKKCTPLWREARFEVRMLKTPQVATTFGR